MKLVVISHPTNFPRETDLVSEMMELGMDTFHLRKPDSKREELEKYLEEIPENFHGRIVLHTYPELTENFKLKGIHFNKRNPLRMENISNPKLTHSQSFHSIKSLMKCSDQLNYVFLSPIFDSVSKEDYKTPFKDKEQLSRDLEQFKLVHQNGPELIALGGLSNKRIEAAQSLGFDGVAVLGYLWRSAVYKKKPERTVEKFLRIQETCRQLQHTY